MVQTINSWFSQQEHELGLGPRATGPTPHFRDAIDAQRCVWRSTPEGSYPDGLANTVGGGRRQDRLKEAVWRSQRPYDRGVHKDSRLDMSDYLWPLEFNLMSGIENQATGMRYVSPAIAAEPVVLTMRGNPNPRDYAGMTGQPNTGVPVQPDADSVAAKKRMLPAWN